MLNNGTRTDARHAAGQLKANIPERIAGAVNRDDRNSEAVRL